MKNLKNKLRREERGFTLTEVLVTIMMMMLILFALYSIFDMGIRVFAFGNDKLEAVENARLGLERMEREIRAAYPCDADNSANDYLFLNPTDMGCSTEAMPNAAQITFANDLSSSNQTGYRKVDFPSEVISYYQNGDQLVRAQGGVAQPVVTPVATDGLRFSYLDNSGSLYTGSTPSQIHAVRISLTIDVDSRTQTLATNVDLRNRE